MTTEVKGAAKAAKQFAKIFKKIARNSIQKGLRRTCRQVIERARANQYSTPPSLGWEKSRGLGRSLNYTIRRYGEGKRVVGYVGHQTGRVFTAKKYGRPTKHVPGNIAHLVERGTTTASAKAYIGPAWKGVRPMFVGIMETAIVEDLQKGGWD